MKIDGGMGSTTTATNKGARQLTLERKRSLRGVTTCTVRDGHGGNVKNRYFGDPAGAMRIGVFKDGVIISVTL